MENMNALKTDQKVQAVSLVCEDVSIRAVERITGIHRDTIMRLGVRIGDACAKIQGDKFKKLNCNHLEID